MKCSLLQRPILLVMAMLCFSIGTLAQNMLLNMSNVTVKQAMNELKNKSGYSFVYSAGDIDTNRKVDIKAANVTDAINQILDGQDVAYEIQERNIVLRKSYIENSKDGVILLRGNVKDSNGEPIVAASVMEKGTQNGTVTDLDGNFSISIAKGSQLAISCLGYESMTLRPDRTGRVDVVMDYDTEFLNEVVVIGYGTIKKKDLTGAVTAVDSKAITDRHATNLTQALQGVVAGLQVTNSNGDPASSATLRVRGVTSIGTSDPLVIVDGVPGDISAIKPEDIENISVLKDAASAAIYGSRAAAGVILITTKRARDGEMRLTYSYEYALRSPTTYPKMVGAIDYMKLKNEIAYNDNPNGGWNQVYAQDIIDNYGQLIVDDPNHYADTDWWKAVFKPSAPRQTHAVGISGGGKNVRTNISLRYDKFGFLDRSENHSREHYYVRANTDFDINKFFEAHADISYRQAKVKNPINLLYNAYRIPATYPAYWTDGRIATVKDSENPIPQMRPEAGNEHIDDNQISFKGELNFKPISQLRLSLVAAPNFQLYDSKRTIRQLGFTTYDDPNTIIGYYPNNKTNQVDQNRNKAYNITMQALSNYNKSFGQHDITLLGGYEYFYQKLDNLGASDNFHELIGYPYLDNAPKDYQYVSGNASEYSYRSWFGRINYAYHDKYLFEANIRYDGSSRFDRGNRWASFPSFSAGWVISEEKFIKSIRHWLDLLKLRASWGKLGNERIGSFYPYQALLTISNVPLVDDSSSITGSTATAQTTYNVRDISWETTSSWDVGLDMLLLNSRLNLTFDYYRKKTSDMLLAVQIPMFMGYDNPQVNAGDMHTNGWDLSAGWRDHLGDFNYSVSFNLSNAVSKMDDLNHTIFYSGNTITREGTEYRQFYGYKNKGIYQTQEDVENSPKLNNNFKIGDIKYEDISGPEGVPDGKISPEYDRVPLKSSLPHYLFGLTLNATWRGFDASIFFQGVGQQYVQYDHDQIVGNNNSWASFPKTLLGNYWSNNNSPEQNAKVKYPRITDTNGEGDYLSSDFWIYNNHYMRCKSITLGYTIPQKIANKFFVDGLRVYMAGENLFSLNNMLSGYDPELPHGQNYPFMCSFIFGVNLNF